MWKNYTASDGLPGNDVFAILSDPQGHLWFVGDQGICRFNGYNFVRPVDTSAARGTEAFVPTLDANGIIWFARLDGSVWRIENDTVKSWKYNPVIKPYLDKFKPVESLSIAENGDVWLAIYGLGFLVVQPNGHHRVLPEPSKPSMAFSNIGGKLFYTYQSRGISLSPTIPLSVISLQNHPFPDISCLFKHHHYRSIWKLRNGDIWLSCQDSSYMIRGEDILWQSPTTIYTHKLVETDEGILLLASHIVESPGLHAFDSPEHIRTDEGTNLLPGQQVTYIHIDREGGWWVSTLRNGVFYASNPEAVFFKETKGASLENITCLASDGVSTVYAGMGNGHLFGVNSRTEEVYALPRPSLISGEIKSLHYDQNHHRLYCSELLHYLENNTWKIVLGDGSPAGILAKSISKGSDASTLWTSSSHGFASIDTKKNWGKRMGIKINSQLPERTFDVTADHKGNIWVATLSGLKLWKDSIYIDPPWHHSALRFQARNISLLPNGGMAISLSGAGILIRNPDGDFTQLTEKDGLNSDFISKLYVSPEGDLYTCSYNGINRIKSDGDRGWDILSIDSKKGLPSNHVKDVVVLNGELWVATDVGLVRLQNLPEPIPMPAPILEDFMVNNFRRAYTPAMHLSYDENNVQIKFYALHFRSTGSIPYRYRLNGVDSAYTYAKAREVHYARLSPGEYAFEVQAQNEDGEWGKTSIWSFQISPAWWNAGWFRAVAILCLIMITGLWIYFRVQKRHKETILKEKIREMEAAALRAQMNPHFIFNCLGSIQHFISENDSDSAMRYLASFARLVRLALHSSVDGIHTLSEEIEMLEHYLTLEQLRFRNIFTFAIKVDSDLNPDEISLPPLLVQPFVENAILHGMKHKENDGRISIHFFQRDSYLNVEITDNGPGLDQDGAIIVSNRKSVGMLLTERRLELLTGKIGVPPLQVENIIGPDGSMEGARVVVRAPLGQLE